MLRSPPCGERNGQFVITRRVARDQKVDRRICRGCRRNFLLDRCQIFGPTVPQPKSDTIGRRLFIWLEAMYPPLLTTCPVRNTRSPRKSCFDCLSEQVTTRTRKAGVVGKYRLLFAAISRFPIGALLRLKTPFAAHLDDRSTRLQLLQENRNLATEVIFTFQVNNQKISNSFGLCTHAVMISLGRNPA